MTNYADGLKEYGSAQKEGYSVKQYRCDKGHIVECLSGFGWGNSPYRCPVCIGQKPTVGENLKDLSDERKKDKNKSKA